jgi:hypothetical protein
MHEIHFMTVTAEHVIKHMRISWRTVIDTHKVQLETRFPAISPGAHDERVTCVVKVDNLLADDRMLSYHVTCPYKSSDIPAQMRAVSASVSSTRAARDTR